MSITTPYTRGLHQLTDGAYAYLQPDGGWGWSNAGLVVSGESSLLVDTLFDLDLTQRMLDEMRYRAPAARSIDTVVNTHANGDHCWGNELCEGSEIIASRRTADEMLATPPQLVAKLMKAARLMARLGPLRAQLGKLMSLLRLEQLANVAQAAPFVVETLGPFDFGAVTLRPPSRVFDGVLELDVGEKRVELLEVGPAHTAGDTMVWDVTDRVLYTGDILFIGAHPIIWDGPVSNWIDACERIIALDPRAIVPGHGPLADKARVEALLDYLRTLRDEVRLRFETGMSQLDAARDIVRALGGSDFAKWKESERLVVNVGTIYRELSGETRKPDMVSCFAQMAALAAMGA
ncbi:MAG: MBL fold metallo-hydrolase [Myxococcales bacterium]|nr:MBL fold metallo-hydrolase [Myxococcales bacterium]